MPGLCEKFSDPNWHILIKKDAHYAATLPRIQ